MRIFSVDLTFSRAAPRLVDYVQYLHVIGQTTLEVLGNIKILARPCPTYGTYIQYTLYSKDIYMQLNAVLLNFMFIKECWKNLSRDYFYFFYKIMKLF